MSKRRSIKGAAQTARRAEARFLTSDSFQNFAAQVGIGTTNQNSQSTYGFNPVSRNRILIEWMYRGAWMTGQAVDCVAEDMTRAGIEVTSDMQPGDIENLQAALTEFAVWKKLNDTIKWARLYGGAIAVMLIDGQDPAKPLRLDTIGRNRFKGLLVLDRWMVQPTLGDLVTEFGHDMGLPRYYDVTADAPALQRMRIHHSRCLRFEGVELPYWQKLTENLWGLSVLERLFDRMVAFDSTTTGAAQLVYKAHLRTYKVKDLRELIAAGGPVYNAFLEQIKLIRQMQTNEGLTLLDSNDEFQTHQYSFSGLSDLLTQFGQQLSGALGIPLVRLFGQSPAGLNSTGESDLRMYYDNINMQQETSLRRPVYRVVQAIARSEGLPLPDNFNFKFAPLWQMTDEQKSQIANTITTAVSGAESAGLVSRKTALQELKHSSRITGVWTNITDEDIEEAEQDAPPMSELGDQPPLPFSQGVADSALDIGGLPVVIENPRGTRREGPGWSVVMPAHYGYIRGTSSAEGSHEQMDCFVGPNLKSQHAWVIETRKPQDGSFDEHKVMLGYDDISDALRDFKAAYSDEAQRRVGDIEYHTLSQLKDWLEDFPFGGK